MTPGSWETVSIEEVCEILDRLRKPITKRDRKPGPYPYYGASGILDQVEGYIFDEPLVLLGEDGAKWEAGENSAFPTNGKTWVNNHAHVMRPDRERLLDEWLIYYLNFTNLLEYVSGLTVPKLNQKSLKAIPIPLPPLSEQRRIVSVLDAAFARLATATAHTQKNLQNARELFETHLLLTIQKSVEQWGISTVADVCKVKSGGTPSKKEQRYWNGDIPWVSAKDLKTDRINTSIDKITKLGASSSSTKIAPVGSVLMLVRGMGLANGLQVGEVTRDVAFNQDVRALIPDERLRPRFLFHQLKATPTEALLSSAAHGTLKIDADKLQALALSLPPVDEQDAILKSIDAVQSHAANLAGSATRKLAALSELKQSLLHRAFRGELSGGEAVEGAAVETAWNNAGPFPFPVDGISTTDLHAGILAMAHDSHENAGKLDRFGHVKAEKQAHMIEALFGIDLGRKPMKEAMGPNDFPHLQKVEHRARMAKFFNFKRDKDGGRYTITKLNSFDRIKQKAVDALGKRAEDVEKLLAWMTPMTVQQAEIVATVFAGWNNLLLEGLEPTNEQIVTESRENWHPRKQEIERSKFFKAIDWLRKEGVVPVGRGKRVEAKKVKRAKK